MAISLQIEIFLLVISYQSVLFLVKNVVVLVFLIDLNGSSSQSFFFIYVINDLSILLPSYI